MIHHMQNEPLYHYFNQYFPLNIEEREIIATVLTEKRLKRRQFILQEGDVAQHYNFVVSGCLKMYKVDEKGNEHNLQFAIENDWIMDIGSFYDETPSKLYIEAIEPSVILQIKKADLLNLFINHHKFDRNFRIIIEKKYVELQNRVMQNISVNAEERYVEFLHKFPILASRLPNTQIASYLGITPEFLSRVRKDIATKPNS